jgi:hypothetical protein
VVAARVLLAHDVKEKGLHVVVQRLVVQKELGQQANVLAVDFALGAVHLKHGERLVAVNLVARRVLDVALGLVAQQRLLALHVLEAKLAHVDALAVAVLLGVGRKVPRVHHVAPQLNLLNVAHLANLLVLLFVLKLARHGVGRHLLCRPLLALLGALLLLLGLGVHRLRRAHVQPVLANPFVQPLVPARVVHIVLKLARSVGARALLHNLHRAFGAQRGQVRKKVDTPARAAREAPYGTTRRATCIAPQSQPPAVVAASLFKTSSSDSPSCRDSQLLTRIHPSAA